MRVGWLHGLGVFRAGRGVGRHPAVLLQPAASRGHDCAQAAVLRGRPCRRRRPGRSAARFAASACASSPLPFHVAAGGMRGGQGQRCGKDCPALDDSPHCLCLRSLRRSRRRPATARTSIGPFSLLRMRVRDHAWAFAALPPAPRPAHFFWGDFPCQVDVKVVDTQAPVMGPTTRVTLCADGQEHTVTGVFVGSGRSVCSFAEACLARRVRSGDVRRHGV